MPAQEAQKQQAKQKGDSTSNAKMAIPEDEIKRNSGVTASMALQAAQKAWELRQAANAAGDPNAREEILAKAINKEIEAESFGKAAKYTRSGAFQGLAAGAGLGVQPGVTLGKLTGALVGGVVATVTGLLGGGVGSVYGAISGPFWDLGEMASKGVRSIVGDFPNWKSTPAQKKALEKMVMQTRETQAPTKEELEQMKADAPDEMSPSWSQTVNDVTSWRPSMPSMPSMPAMPSMPSGAAMGLGGLSASMPSWGGRGKGQDQKQAPNLQNQRTQSQTQQANQATDQQEYPGNRRPPKQASQQPRESPKPQEAPRPKEAPTPKEAQKPKETPRPKETSKPKETSMPKQGSKPVDTRSQRPPVSNPSPKPQAVTKPTGFAAKPQASPPKQASEPQATRESPTAIKRKQIISRDSKGDQNLPTADAERRKPRKLATKSSNVQPTKAPATRKAPRKLESRKPVA